MNETERRRHPRYQTKLGVTISFNNQEIPGELINISEGGIGVVAEKLIYPGAQVRIAVKYVDDYCIHGIVRWTHLHYEDKSIYHRMGIEIETILVDIDKDIIETPERSEFVRKIVSANQLK